MGNFHIFFRRSILTLLEGASLLLYFLSEEGSRGRTGDADLYELSDVVVTLVDDHCLVLLGATHHLLTAALAEVLDEDGEFLALILLVLLSTHLGLQLDQLVEAGYLGFLRNVVWQMLGCVGYSSMAVLPLLLTASSMNSSSLRRTCIIWRLIMPARILRTAG